MRPKLPAVLTMPLPPLSELMRVMRAAWRVYDETQPRVDALTMELFGRESRECCWNVTKKGDELYFSTFEATVIERKVRLLRGASSCEASLPAAVKLAANSDLVDPLLRVWFRRERATRVSEAIFGAIMEVLRAVLRGQKANVVVRCGGELWSLAHSQGLAQLVDVPDALFNTIAREEFERNRPRFDLTAYAPEFVDSALIDIESVIHTDRE